MRHRVQIALLLGLACAVPAAGQVWDAEFARHGPNGRVFDVCSTANELVAVGSFTNVFCQPSNGVARFDLATQQWVGSGTAILPRGQQIGEVYSVAEWPIGSGGFLLVGDFLIDHDGNPITPPLADIVRWAPGSPLGEWQPFDAGLPPASNRIRIHSVAANPGPGDRKIAICIDSPGTFGLTVFIRFESGGTWAQAGQALEPIRKPA